jgi:hypothetical protein
VTELRPERQSDRATERQSAGAPEPALLTFSSPCHHLARAHHHRRRHPAQLALERCLPRPRQAHRRRRDRPRRRRVLGHLDQARQLHPEQRQLVLPDAQLEESSAQHCLPSSRLYIHRVNSAPMYGKLCTEQEDCRRHGPTMMHEGYMCIDVRE